MAILDNTIISNILFYQFVKCSLTITKNNFYILGALVLIFLGLTNKIKLYNILYACRNGGIGRRARFRSV